MFKVVITGKPFIDELTHEPRKKKMAEGLINDPEKDIVLGDLVKVNFNNGVIAYYNKDIIGVIGITAIKD